MEKNQMDPNQASIQIPIGDSTNVSPTASEVLGERKRRKYTRRKKEETSQEQPAQAIQLDSEVIAQSVKTALKAIDSLACKRLYRAAFYVSNGDAKFSAGLVSQAEITPDELDVTGKLSASVCLKYQILGQHAEIVMLIGLMGGYAARLILVQREINKLYVAAKKAGLLERDDAK